MLLLEILNHLGLLANLFLQLLIVLRYLLLVHLEVVLFSHELLFLLPRTELLALKKSFTPGLRVLLVF